MNEDYLLELYSFLGTQDQTFSQDVAFEQFVLDMGNESYAGNIRGFLAEKDPNFGKDVSLDEFLIDIKKKDGVEVVDSVSEAGPLDLQQPSVTKEKITEEDFFQGGFGDALRAFDSISPIGLGDFVDDMARSIASGRAQGLTSENAADLMIYGAGSSEEDIESFLEANKNSQNYGASAEMQDYQRIYEEEGKGVWGVVKGLAHNPSVLNEVILTSLSSLANNSDAMIAGGAVIGTSAGVGALTAGTAATAVVPVVGTVVGAAAGAYSGAVAAMPYAFGAASAMVEMGATFSELLQEELGNQEMTAENVREILEDPEKFTSIRNKAIARGAIIGTLDAFTGKVASGVGAKILTSSAKKSVTGMATRGGVMKSIGTGAGIESIGGSAGESLARAAIGQDQDISDIMLEGVTNLPGGVRSTLQARLSKPIYKVNGKKETAQTIDELIATMTPDQLASSDIKISNDYEGRAKKIQDIIVTGKTRQLVALANPELNDATLDAITALELQVKSFENNKTETGKSKVSELKAAIADLQEIQLADEVSQDVKNTFESLESSEQIQRKTEAGRVLLEEKTTALGPDSQENVSITDEEITQRALEIFSKEKPISNNNINKQYNQLSPKLKLTYVEQASDIMQEEAEDQGLTEFNFTEEDINERAAILLNEDLQGSKLQVEDNESVVGTSVDKKGRTVTYISKTTKKDGVTKTSFNFNRDDKDASQRGAAGVTLDEGLPDGYKVSENDAIEGYEITKVYEVREGDNGNNAATVEFTSPEESFRGEVVLEETNEVAKTPQKETQASDKVDEINKRREEELDSKAGRVFPITIENTKENSNLIKEKKNQEKKIDEINAKYDSEIANLTNEEQADIETFFSPDSKVDDTNTLSGSNLGINRNKAPKLNSQQNKNKNRLVRIAEMGAKAIAKVLPDVRMVLHESNEEYLRFAKEGKGRAEYHPENNIIHINLSEATTSTVPHEIFHAVLINKIKGDPAIAKAAEAMMLSVRKSLSNNSELAQKIDKFAAAYTGTQEQFQNEERLAELIGILSSAEAFKGLSKPTKNIIIQWLKDFAKKYGIKIGSDFGKKDSDVIDLLNTIARKTRTGEEIEESDIKSLEELDSGTNPVGTPTKIEPSKSRQQKIKFKDSYNKSLVNSSLSIDLNALIEDIHTKNQKVWFWVADQLGIDKELGLDGGPSFAHQNPNEIWASGMKLKAIEKNIAETDYLFIISGSPTQSQLFNKKVYDNTIEKLGDFNTFKDQAISTNAKSEIIQVLEAHDSWASLREDSTTDTAAKKKTPNKEAIDKKIGTGRKKFLYALGKTQNTPNTKFTQYMNSIDGYTDQNTFRDGFYRENDFKQNDIMLVLKPTGVQAGSNHSTYENTVLGEVVGVPDTKIDASEIMPNEMRIKMEGKPRNNTSQSVAPYGSGRRNIEPKSKSATRQQKSYKKSDLSSKNMIGFLDSLENALGINENGEQIDSGDGVIPKFINNGIIDKDLLAGVLLYEAPQRVLFISVNPTLEVVNFLELLNSQLNDKLILGTISYIKDQLPYLEKTKNIVDEKMGIMEDLGGSKKASLSDKIKSQQTAQSSLALKMKVGKAMTETINKTYDAIWKKYIEEDNGTKSLDNKSPSVRQQKDDYKPNDPVIVTRPVEVINAPKGVFVNVGMIEGQTDVEISQETIESRLPKDVKIIKSKVKKKEVGETEDTLLLKLSRPLTNTEMKDFLVSNKQQAIGQMVDGKGILYGNDQTEIDDNWGGEFSPQYFPTFNGTVLKSSPKARQQKDNERESSLERAMSEIDNIISKSKKRGTKFSKIPQNVVNYLQGTKVYEESTDVQREQMVRDVRELLGIKEKKAPSVKRILGDLKSAKTFTLTDKQLVIKTIKDLNRGANTAVKSFRIASQILAKEFTGMVKSGNLTIRQSAALVRKFSKVDMLSDASIENFVEYMARVVNNADYLNQISKARKLASRAKKNITKKIGIADAISNQLRTIFSIKPTLIPESVFQNYLSLLEMFGENAAVLSPSNISEVNEMTQDILRVMDEEFSMVEELAQRYEAYDTKVEKDGNINFAETVKNMLNENLIDETEADLMMKHRSSIVPSVEKTVKTEAEIQAEKDQVIKNILESKKVSSSSLPSRDEVLLAKKFKSLVKNKEVLNNLSLEDLNQIEKLIQNINNGYLPHLSQIMTEKMNAIIDGNKLSSAIKSAKIPRFSKMYAKLKNIILRNKRGAISEAIRRNPLYYIDQVFGNFKSKAIFNSLFERSSVAQEKFSVDLKFENGKIDKAEQEVFKSFKRDGNKTLISKFKQMVYMIQLEHDSNIGNPEVNQASGFIKKTIEKIDAGETTFTMDDAVMLQEIYDKFSFKDSNGKSLEIDIDKLYKSFNKAEVESIKTIQEVNRGLGEKAVFTSAIIRGDKISPRDNYVHLNVLADTKSEASVAPTTISDFNKSLRPSTKAKSLIKRQGVTSAINFDIYASARKGVKGVLLDYHLTEPIRTARRTIIQAEAALKGNKTRVDTGDRETLTAIKEAFNEVVENLLTNSYTETSIGSEALKWIQKNGYRAILASAPRWVAELSSNAAFAMITNPVSFIAGSKFGVRFLNSDVASKSMRALGSKQTTRVYPNDDMSARMVDSRLLNQTEGVRGGRAEGKVKNKLKQIWNTTGKKYQGAVSVVADGLISTPDKIVMRPMWFGKFSNEFKKITGISPDFDKISEQDEAYMSKYELELNQSTKVADETSVMTGSTANPFMGILKGTSNPNQHITVKAFNAFNNFMTTFLIYEYVTARTGIVNAIGRGHLTKTKGAQLLAGSVTRMVMYTMMSQVLSEALGGLAEDEPEKPKDIEKKLGQAFASTFSSMLFGRDFGNSTKAIVNWGLEEFNKEYLDGLRDGDYDVYKDSIQYQIVPKSKSGKGTSIGDWLVNMSASLGPMVKTIDLILKKATEGPKKTEGAIQRRSDEISIRIPLEVLGNTGFIPMYKDVRKLVLKSMYDGMAQKAAASKDKKQRAIDLLQGYENQTDMKRYNPSLWADTFGPNSPDYYSNQQKLKEKSNLRKEKQRLKDLENGYYPLKKKGLFSGQKKKGLFSGQKRKGLFD